MPVNGKILAGFEGNGNITLLYYLDF